MQIKKTLGETFQTYGGKEMRCSICGEDIEKKYLPDGRMYWDNGNNAEPINDGRCCDKCDWAIVIPARLAQMRKR